MAEEKPTLAQLMAQPMKSMEEAYAGKLPPEKLPEAKNRLAEIERSIRHATPQNSCGTALLRLAKRARLLHAQILRSERA
jgi:hypothetical protein